MNKQISLHEFGYNFLGPITSEYLFRLKEILNKNPSKKLLFLAREGYFLKMAYEKLVQADFAVDIERQYLNVSRVFLFKITVGDPEARALSLKTNFDGTLRQLLSNRFGFTLQLPLLEEKLAGVSDQLSALVEQSKIAYLQYLQSLSIPDNSLMIDLGYSGTIQKLLTYLLHKNTRGIYFITTKQGQHKIDKHTATMHSVYKDRVSLGDGYTMLDRSLLLEALLTSPQGQFCDIKKSLEEVSGPYQFLFGKKVYAQLNPHELKCIHDGALECILDCARHDIRFSIQEIEELFESYATQRGLFPRVVWPLFDVDDDVSGNGSVNPLQLFRI
jgi:hypothetical protein